MTSVPPAKLQHPKHALARLGVTAKRRFSQNFLTNPELAAKIAARAASPGGTSVEIGPGLGALTLPLLGSGQRVVCIESDRDMVEALTRRAGSFLESGQLEIILADARHVNLPDLLDRTPAPHVLAGNLPYSVTGALLRLAIELAPRLLKSVFLVQREVAERAGAVPGTPSYGALSVFLQAAYATEKAFTVGRGAFYPRPQVDSALLVLTPHSAPPTRETPEFQQLVRLAFQERRKTLKNAWSKIAGVTPQELASAAERASIDLGARGETLTVADFARMSSELWK